MSTFFPFDRLVGFATAILEMEGVPHEGARTCALRLVEADARGQRAHGIARLPAYARRIEQGGLNARATPHLQRETPVAALVDGNNGLGPVVMTFATALAVAKTRESGMAWIGIRGSNHAGACGVYAQLLVDEGLVGIVAAVANTNQMAPWGGTDRLLGPNPIAIGVPAGDEPAVILDMATSTVAFGTIRHAVAAGQTLPVGWLIGKNGQPVTDPQAIADATLAPIGGYKGYGLSLMIAILAGTLNGAAAGSQVVDHYEDLTTPTNTGQLIVALDIEQFRPRTEFQRELDERIREIRTSTRMEGVDSILVPGDRAMEQRVRAARSGIELSPPLLEELKELAKRLGTRDTLDH